VTLEGENRPNRREAASDLALGEYVLPTAPMTLRSSSGHSPQAQETDQRANMSPQMDPLPDQTPTMTLIRRHRAGDGNALNALFLRHYEKVFRLVRVKLHGRPPPGMEIEDVVQNAMLDAIDGIRTFEPREDADWTDWVVRVALNHLKGDVRAENTVKRHPPQPLESLQTASGSWRNIAAEVTGVITQLVRSEEKRRLDACVSALTGLRRAVIVQRDYLGREWGEIARELGKRVGACQQLHLRARCKLAELLAADSGGDVGAN
jgi:RNA polymerase sigma factor (sigma-70 family)